MYSSVGMGSLSDILTCFREKRMFFICCHQTAGQNHCSKLAKESSENVALGMRVKIQIAFTNKLE
jgi:hypothetical protein